MSVDQGEFTMRPSLVKSVLQVGGSVAFLYVLSRMVPYDQLSQVLRSADGRYLLLAGLAVIPAVFTRVWRWQYLMGRQGVHAPMISVARPTLIGMGLNLVLPASAGDIARSYFGWKLYGHKEIMLVTSISDKVVALVALFALGAISGFLSGFPWLAMGSLGFFLALIVVLLLPMRRPFAVLSRLTELVLKRRIDPELLARKWRMDPRTLGWATLISLLGWVFTNLVYYYCLRSVVTNAHFMYVFALAPLVNIIRSLPISVSGIGTADAFLVYSLEKVSINGQTALAASLMVNCLLIIAPGLVGLLLMLFRGRTQQEGGR